MLFSSKYSVVREGSWIVLSNKKFCGDGNIQLFCRAALSNKGVTCHIWLLSPENVADTPEDLNFLSYLNCN